MDIYDLTPRTIDAELVWVLNTSEGTEYPHGAHMARISWPINKGEIEKLAPTKREWEIRRYAWHYVKIYVNDENNCRQYIGSVENGHDPV